MLEGDAFVISEKMKMSFIYQSTRELNTFPLEPQL